MAAHPGDLLSYAFEVLNARGTEYETDGGIEQSFREIAAIASVITAKHFTARDVAVVMHCVKLIRSKADPRKLDNYVDGMNYWAIAGCCSELPPIPAPKAAPAKPAGNGGADAFDMNP
jgi:hypothetical protein